MDPGKVVGASGFEPPTPRSRTEPRSPEFPNNSRPHGTLPNDSLTTEAGPYSPSAPCAAAHGSAAFPTELPVTERLKAHAWKAISARLTDRHGNTSSSNQFNDLPL